MQNRMRITHKSRQKTLEQNISRGLVCKIHKPSRVLLKELTKTQIIYYPRVTENI